MLTVYQGNTSAGDGSKPGMFDWHVEYWVGISYYLDNPSATMDNWAGVNDLIFQLHGIVNDGDWSKCGTSGPNGITIGVYPTSHGWTPYHALAIFVDNLNSEQYGTRNPYSTPPSASAAYYYPDWYSPIGNYENRWMDIVMNFVLSPDNDGFVKIWIDGTQVVDDTGPNMFYYDRCGNPAEPAGQLQMGSYWSENRPEIYITNYLDEVRFARAIDGAGYNDVAPRGSSVPTNSPPVLNAIGNKNVIEGNTLDVSLSSSDPDGDSRNFSVSSNPGFVTLTDSQDGTGRLRIAPQAGNAGSYNMTVQVTDSKGASDSESITVTVTAAPNAAPVLAAIGNKTLTAGNVMNVQISATDANGDNLTFTLPTKPAFATLTDNNDGTGVIRLAPTTSQAGTYNLTCRVADGNGGADSETITITVNPPPNAAPVLASIGNKTLTAGNVMNVQISATDANGDNLTFTLPTKPAFATLTDNNDGTGVIRLAPSTSQAGTYSLTCRVADGNGGADSETITITVNPPPNAAPVLAAIGNKTLTAGNTMNVQITATDANGDNLTFTLPTKPAFATLTDNNDGTGVIRLAPTTSQAGTYSLTCRVADGNGGADSETITITVNPPPNAAPVLAAIGNKTLTAGNMMNVQITATDANGDALTFTLPTKPAFATLTDNNDGTGVIRLAPTTSQAGTYSLTCRVADGNGGADSETITITVNPPPNAAPVLAAIGNKTLTAGNTMNVQISATDANGDNLTFTLPTKPAFATLTDNNDGTGVIRLAPTTSQAGTYSLTCRVADGNGGADSETITITVNPPPNAAPVLAAIGNKTLTAGNVMNVQITATDANGDTLTFTLPTKPAFATLTDNNDGTGVIRLAPTTSQAGTYSLTCRVADGNGGADSETITITVNPPPNAAPVLATIGNKTLTAGNTMNVQISATDANGDNLTFTLPTKPAFATLTDNNDGTGVIRLAPTTSQAGTYSLTCRVADGNGGADSETITIIVNPPPNAAPVLAAIGNKTLTAGNTMNVQISATDANGDTLTFTLPTKPAFATLTDNNDGTGVIRLAPTTSQAGTYSLTCRVADGNGGADSETITIIVNPSPNSAPVLAAIGNKTVTEGSVINVQLSATDANGDALTFSVAPNLAFVTLTDNQDGTGVLRLAPVAGQTGSYSLTVQGN